MPNEYPYGDAGEPARNNPDGHPYDSQQNPYGASQYPYSEPENQDSSYASADGYGAAGNRSDYNFNYNYGMPEGRPLPLGEAIRQLPGQYRRILLKPSAMTFAIEKGKASWDIIWVQLLGYSILVALFGLLANLLNPYRYPGTTLGTQLTPAMFQAIQMGTSIGLILAIPLSFFIGVGILHLIAKAFKGQGSFLEYAYSSTLFVVPLGILGGILGIIPVASIFFGLAISIYELVLYVFATMAVHRLSAGKATTVVLLPTAILVILLCAFLFLIVAMAAALINGGR